jgi:hypothetical protein
MPALRASAVKRVLGPICEGVILISFVVSLNDVENGSVFSLDPTRQSLAAETLLQPFQYRSVLKALLYPCS